MIRLFLGLFLGLMSWTVVAAQIVTARSGEHDGFTRIVFQVPAGTAWSLQQSGQTAELNVELENVRFDTGQVFNRIARTRLTALSQSGPGEALKLQLGCECEVVGFTQSGSLLVVDIKDREEKEPPRALAYLRPLNQPAYRFRPAPRPEPMSGLPSRRQNPELPPFVGALVSGRPGTEDGGLAQSTVLIPEAEIDLTPGINISEQRLLDQIRRAADQGLLTPLVPLPSGTDGAGDTDVVTGVGQRPATLPANVSVTTSIDRDMTMAASAVQIQAERRCMQSDLVAVYDWGDERPFGTQISAWRAELFEEFDRVKPDSALGLARNYLHFGFGAEALRALEVVPDAGSGRPVLEAMASLLDYGKLSGTNPFSGQQGCDGDVALWAVLSLPDLPDATNVGSVQRAFARLPAHLRVHIGPDISRRFTDAGDAETAGAILRAVSRAGDEMDPAFDLAEATLVDLQGDPGAAARRMSEVVATGSDQSPEAIVKLVQARWQERAAIQPDIPDLAAAYALEYRDGDLGPDLRRAHVTALALAGRFPEAMEQLADLARRDGDEATELARLPFLTLLIERADDLTFLKYALQYGDGKNNGLPAGLGDDMARRMLELGFAGPALALLSAPGDSPATPERRMIRARAALARELPHRALVELLGLSGPDADRLRAEAMWQNGDFRQAGNMLLAAQDPDGATRGFWLSEAWEEMPAAVDSRYRQVADVTAELSRPETGIDSLTPLAQARALIERSSVARVGISELLQYVEVEPVVR